MVINAPGWWFGTFFFGEFPFIGNNDPNWQAHIFQRGRSTTNQMRFQAFIAKWTIVDFYTFVLIQSLVLIHMEVF